VGSPIFLSQKQSTLRCLWGIGKVKEKEEESETKRELERKEQLTALFHHYILVV
jgi:hypothetical protein